MAGTLTQSAVDAGNKSIQHIMGNKGLDGTGKAAAMDTVSAAAIQIMLAQGQGNSHILMLLVAGGNDVLQIHVGRIATLLNQLQELIEVACAQRCNLLGNAGIFLIEVDGAHHSTVTASLAA